MVKYLVAPSKMPDELTWFKWEAYSTWISGMALMSLVYYGSTSLYMIDLEVLDITQGQAVLLSLGGILVGWVIYDGLCRSPLGRNDLILALSGLIFLIILSVIDLFLIIKKSLTLIQILKLEIMEKLHYQHLIYLEFLMILKKILFLVGNIVINFFIFWIFKHNYITPLWILVIN